MATQKKEAERSLGKIVTTYEPIGYHNTGHNLNFYFRENHESYLLPLT
jgi:hypothetical protein